MRKKGPAVAAVLVALVVAVFLALAGRFIPDSLEPLPLHADHFATQSLGQVRVREQHLVGPEEVMAYRFLDHLAEARHQGRSVERAYRRFPYWRKILSPYARPGRMLWESHLEVGLEVRPRALLKEADLNEPGHGLDDSRSSLFAPPPCAYEFEVSLPGRCYLDFAIAVVGAPGAIFAVEVVSGEGTTNRIFERPLRQRNIWQDQRVNLSPFGNTRVVLRLVTEPLGGEARGEAGNEEIIAKALFANPVLWRPREVQEQPWSNVVFVVVDAMRTDALGAYGGHRGITPHMDHLAAQGVVMRNAACAANWTRPSTVAMLSSEYASLLGLNQRTFLLSPEVRGGFYSQRPPLLPLFLRSTGWISRAVGNNLFILGYPKIGLDHGFEHVTDIRMSVLDTPEITRVAEGFLRDHRHRPFFLFVNYNAPHSPYTPPGGYRARVREAEGERLAGKARSYYGEVAYTDPEVGQLMATLKELGLEERTLVVLTADHGEVLHHDDEVPGLGRKIQYRHASSLYDEEVHVPLILRYPGRIPAGLVAKEQVSLLDLPPTILDLLGQPKDPRFRGRSFAQAALGQKEAPNRAVLIEGRKAMALRTASVKYVRYEPGFETVRSLGGRRVKRGELLFDLEADPGEWHDLSERRPDLLERMRARLKARLADRTPLGGQGAASAPIHIRFTSDGQPHSLVGQVRIKGRILKVKAMGATPAESVGLSEGDSVLTIRWQGVSREAGVDLEVRPPSADVAVDLTLDGQALTRERTLVGPFGLSLFPAPLRLEGKDLAFAASATPPLMYPGRELAVYLWLAGGSRSSWRADDPSSGLTKEVEDVLKDWGYIDSSKSE